LAWLAEALQVPLAQLEQAVRVARSGRGPRPPQWRQEAAGVFSRWAS
jgi:hypothetical protein